LKALSYITPLALALISASAQSAPATPRAPGSHDVTALKQVGFDVSRPLRDLVNEVAREPLPPVPKMVFNQRLRYSELNPSSAAATDSDDAQRDFVRVPAPAAIVAFNGLGIADGGGFIPPDTTGDVSPTHVFQWVNSSWALFNKSTGARITGANPGNSFFSGFGGLCESTNNGDPLVLWDDQAQRWIGSQFAFTSTSSGPWLQCIAVSTSSDPLGTYYRYAYEYPAFNDYGKMGIWRTADGTQDAYLFTMHEFLGSFQGTSYTVAERARMLAGSSRAQFYRVTTGQDNFGALPFHMEGTAPAPAGACPVFVHFNNAGTGYRFWDLCVDWNAGSVSFNATPEVVPTNEFALGLAGIPQLSGGTTRLDDFDSNLMYIAALRAFPASGPREMRGVVNHAVDVGSDRAGARWVEFGLSAPQGNPDVLFANAFERVQQKLAKRVRDQGVYAPGTDHRWMGSINMDQSGNIGLGYNVSGTVNPEIRFTGRTPSDAAGTMRDESTCTPPNTGAQLGGIPQGRPFARWGDYSMTAMDPDECTFWHTGEYLATTSNASWTTRVCSFRFAECGTPDFALEVAPTTRLAVCASDSRDPFVNARVAGLGSFTGNTTLAASSFPAGSTPTFSPNPVAPGGTSVLTIGGARALAAGEYTGTVTGTNGALVRSAQVRFGVSTGSAAAATLVSPANGSTGASIRPSLSWNAVAGATRYRVEVANNAAFSPVLETGIATTNSYVTSTLLTVGTQYFWRVRSLNFCGEGALSAVASFTTGAPGVCPSGTGDSVVFSDTIEGDTVPWVTQNVSGDAATLWSKIAAPGGTGLNSRVWFNGNSATAGVQADQRLTSPAIALPAANRRPITLAFDAHHQFETSGPANCWDGGFVEISTDGGTTYSPLGNQRNLIDPYPGAIEGGVIAGGTEAWCRQPTPGTSIRTTFTLDEFAGQNVRLRFRTVADDNTVGPSPAGWAIDNVVVKGCQ
jgi:hypothetical protein